MAGLVAGGLVVAGILLWMLMDRSLLVVAGLGAFGPGILRELGWLRDQDEFQRQAAHRAGYHAWLVGGLAAVLVLSVLELGDAAAEAPVEWIRLILALMWLSWLFSALLAYWGAKSTARRVLLVFGSFWLVFAVATVIGEAGSAAGAGEVLVGVLAGAGIVAPFFVLSWAAGRWPRASGSILVVVAAAFVVVFGGGARGGLALPTVLLTQTILVVPLAASGIALLGERRGDAGDESDREADRAPAGAAV